MLSQREVGPEHQPIETVLDGYARAGIAPAAKQVKGRMNIFGAVRKPAARVAAAQLDAAAGFKFGGLGLARLGMGERGGQQGGQEGGNGG